jgi:hypothetical protein
MNCCALVALFSLLLSGTARTADSSTDLASVRIRGFLGDTKAGRLLSAIERAETLWNSSLHESYSYVWSSSTVLNPGPSYEIHVKDGVCTARLHTYLGKPIRNEKIEQCGERQSMEGLFAYARWVATSGVEVKFDEQLGYVQAITHLEGGTLISDFKILCGRLTNTCSAP